MEKMGNLGRRSRAKGNLPSCVPRAGAAGPVGGEELEPVQNPEGPDGVERENSRLSADGKDGQDDAFRLPNP